MCKSIMRNVKKSQNKTLHLDLEIQTQNVEDGIFELFLEDGIGFILEEWGGGF